jgi:outer membrane protein
MNKQVNTKDKTNTQSGTNSLAVIDVQAIVNTSAQVRELKEKQAIKVGELNVWLRNAQNEVNAEQDRERQQALLQKYNAEFNLKRRDLNIKYQEELKVVCDNITQTVADEAKKKGYSMVIAKSVVVCGGVDITEEIAKIVK